MRIGPTHVALVLFAAFAVSPNSVAQRHSADTQITVAEQYLFNAANAERAQRGLPAVRWDNALYAAAAYHADAMAAHRTISHQFSGEPELSERGARAGAHFSVISENVAMAPTAVEIHDMWMKSPHHRDNLLDRTVDHIAIRVVRSGGELYAVEDFEKSVANLSLNDQEQVIADLVQRSASIDMIPTTEESRRTCAMSSGYAGARKPWFVMRFTAGSLDRLPDDLQQKLTSGRYHQAQVAACRAHDAQNFTAYNIAVMLYP